MTPTLRKNWAWHGGRRFSFRRGGGSRESSGSLDMRRGGGAYPALRTVLNIWTTSTRLHSDAQSGCIVGCGTEYTWRHSGGGGRCGA